ncbi:MAG: tripartite tricarboxylate transporter TctB family protein [Rhodospirillales bacterium]|nr:tripartite tricarboxylate transporter TctB family protein [Rhodospirillales bacterium]
MFRLDFVGVLTEQRDMDFSLRRLVPLAFFITALGYIAFVFSLETSKMIGDVYDYDPGGQIIPLLAGIILAAASLRLVISERLAVSQEVDLSTRRLVLVNIGLSVLFIALFRPLGFVISTGLMMFFLIYFNQRALEVRVSIRSSVWWLALTMVYLISLYSVSRGVVKSFFAMARTYQNDLFREPFLQATAVLAVLIPLIFVVGLILKRFSSSREFPVLVQTSVSTTMAIYVIFRQLFLVQLPAGVLSW